MDSNLRKSLPFSVSVHATRAALQTPTRRWVRLRGMGRHYRDPPFPRLQQLEAMASPLWAHKPTSPTSVMAGWSEKASWPSTQIKRGTATSGFRHPTGTTSHAELLTLMQHKRYAEERERGTKPPPAQIRSESPTSHKEQLELLRRVAYERQARRTPVRPAPSLSLLLADRHKLSHVELLSGLRQKRYAEMDSGAPSALPDGGHSTGTRTRWSRRSSPSPVYRDAPARRSQSSPSLTLRASSPDLRVMRLRPATTSPTLMSNGMPAKRNGRPTSPLTALAQRDALLIASAMQAHARQASADTASFAPRSPSPSLYSIHRPTPHYPAGTPPPTSSVTARRRAATTSPPPSPQNQPPSPASVEIAALSRARGGRFVATPFVPISQY